MSPFYRWQSQNLLLHCHLQPKSNCDEFAGVYGDRLKIRVTAPPVDGKANKHLIKFVAKQFGVAKSSVTLVKGELSRQKTLQINRPKKLPEGLSIKKS
jgi:uncharacterized protein